MDSRRRGCGRQRRCLYAVVAFCVVATFSRFVTASFSTGMRFSVNDLNDFIAPEEKCILPLQGGISTKPPPGSVAAPIHGSSATKRRKKRQPPLISNATASGMVGSNVSSPTAANSTRTKKRRGKKSTAQERQAIVATVSLSDCLSCSGCVTSSEEILLEKHSTAVLTNASADPRKYCVVTLSPQACASLAAANNLTLTEAEEKVCWFLRSLGVERVFCSALSTELALAEACTEFVERWSAARGSSGSHATEPSSASPSAQPPHPEPSSSGSSSASSLPVLCSECPGFVLFAEKKHPEDLLPLLSRAKSPQAISASLLKRLLRHKLLPPDAAPPSTAAAAATRASSSNGNFEKEDIHSSSSSSSVGSHSSLAGRGGRRVWHCAVMPCLDKKLESAREELTIPGSDQGGAAEPETDCVVTTSELAALLASRAPLPLPALPASPLDSFHSLLASGLLPSPSSLAAPRSAPPSPRPPPPSAPSASDALPPPAVLPFSNGYLETVARFAAFHLFGLRLPPVLSMHFPRPGNSDLQELTITSPSGEACLRFAAVYGYRHIQNLLARIQRRECEYHYVEVMSCPSGCTNGGAQLPALPLPRVHRRFEEGVAPATQGAAARADTQQETKEALREEVRRQGSSQEAAAAREEAGGLPHAQGFHPRALWQTGYRPRPMSLASKLDEW